jgi:FtsZ-interacting cell division protein ZipA
MDRNQIIIIAIAVIVVVALVVGAVWLMRRRRSNRLRSEFGPEYSRTVEEAGEPSKAEADLLKRQKRVESLKIRELPAADRQRFVAYWEKVQAEFVDSPDDAVHDADSLLRDVMDARGYPVLDFEQRAADLSVNHPEVVQNYRAGHDIALRQERGEASTEDLRRAMIHYRQLFDELVAA